MNKFNDDITILNDLHEDLVHDLFAVDGYLSYHYRVRERIEGRVNKSHTECSLESINNLRQILDTIENKLKEE